MTQNLIKINFLNKKNYFICIIWNCRLINTQYKLLLIILKLCIWVYDVYYSILNKTCKFKSILQISHTLLFKEFYTKNSINIKKKT